jgi:hypothetical protein
LARGNGCTIFLVLQMRKLRPSTPKHVVESALSDNKARASTEQTQYESEDEEEGRERESEEAGGAQD